MAAEIRETGINRVVLNKGDGTSETLIDLTDATLFDDYTGACGADYILEGQTAYGATGIKITGAIPSLGATQYTPSTEDQTISQGQYLSGTQTILGDSNLTAENIANGVSIFGVTGAYEGSSGFSKYSTVSATFDEDIYPVNDEDEAATTIEFPFEPKMVYMIVFGTKVNIEPPTEGNAVVFSLFQDSMSLDVYMNGTNYGTQDMNAGGFAVYLDSSGYVNGHVSSYCYWKPFSTDASKFYWYYNGNSTWASTFIPASKSFYFLAYA